MPGAERIEAIALTAGSRRATFLWWLVWLLWLPFFIPSVQELIQAHPPLARLAASVIGVALYFAVYLRTTWRSARNLASPWPRFAPTWTALWAPILILMALNVALVLLNPQGWSELFYYTGAGAAGWLPTRQATRAVGGVLLLLLLVDLLIHDTLADLGYAAVFVGVTSFAVIAIVRSVTTAQRLRAEREEMARLAAVAEERLRIARDLHDLLGRNLSLIALKSELAGRLVEAAPERAKREIGDVERVSRKALSEVREAVAGYRQPTLAGELHSAQEMLAAAGITYSFEGDDAATSNLAPAIEAALSWTVREAITNVIRHSDAHHCDVHLRHETREADELRLVVSNDGAARSTAATASPEDSSGGNGLRGLRERVGALGGRCESETHADGGFCLSVSLPLEHERGVMGTTATGAAARLLRISQARAAATHVDG
ncbi:MAG: sensor histidine kinase [Ktedonobacterales bacterium]